MKNHTIGHILLVDDDQDDCELFGEALHEFAPSVQLSCLNENELLLQKLEEKKPELIFMDVNMPRKNGYECLKEIKDSDVYKNIPVVMYSNTHRPADIERAYQGGAVLFLRKPNTFRGLVEALQHVLEQKWNEPSGITAQYFANGRYHPFS